VDRQAGRLLRAAGDPPALQNGNTRGSKQWTRRPGQGPPSLRSDPQTHAGSDAHPGKRPAFRL